MAHNDVSRVGKVTEARFLDPINVRIISDAGAPAFETLSAFTFFHPEREVTVEPGFQTTAVHKPFERLEHIEYCISAGILYDWILRRESIVRGDADRMFCDALKVCGVRPGVVQYIYQQLLVSRYARGGND